MTLQLSEILKSKQALRKRLGALPIAETPRTKPDHRHQPSATTHGGRKTCRPADIRRLMKVLGDESEEGKATRQPRSGRAG